MQLMSHVLPINTYHKRTAGHLSTGTYKGSSPSNEISGQFCFQ